MADFVEQLEKDALNSGLPIADLLRRALVVARKHKLKEFAEWIELEQNGYPESKEVPPYRILSGTPGAHHRLRGWEEILTHNLDPNTADDISTFNMPYPVGEIESDLRGAGPNTYMFVYYSRDVEQMLINALNIPARPSVRFTTSQFQGVLDAVRNKVLEWCHEARDPAVDGQPASVTAVVALATDTDTKSSGDQLYRRIMDLRQDKAPLDETNATLIIELIDDAIHEYGNTNQERKVTLRQLRKECEQVLPPATIEELKRRAEGHFLKKAYPKNQAVRFLVYAVILVVIAGSAIFGTWTILEKPKPLLTQSQTPGRNETKSSHLRFRVYHFENYGEEAREKQIGQRFSARILDTLLISQLDAQKGLRLCLQYRSFRFAVIPPTACWKCLDN